MANKPLLTTAVGSYPKPAYLIKARNEQPLHPALLWASLP